MLIQATTAKSCNLIDFSWKNSIDWLVINKIYFTFCELYAFKGIVNFNELENNNNIITFLRSGING